MSSTFDFDSDVEAVAAFAHCLNFFFFALLDANRIQNQSVSIFDIDMSGC